MNRIWADAIMAAHFLWVAFMIGGFAVQMIALKSLRVRNWTALRVLHAGGIVYVAVLIVIDVPCPLTIWEARLRAGVATTQPPSFLIQWIERLIYPDVDPLFVYAPTILLAAISLIAIVICPPERIRRWFRFKA